MKSSLNQQFGPRDQVIMWTEQAHDVSPCAESAEQAHDVSLCVESAELSTQMSSEHSVTLEAWMVMFLFKITSSLLVYIARFICIIISTVFLEIYMFNKYIYSVNLEFKIF